MHKNFAIQTSTDELTCKRVTLKTRHYIVNHITTIVQALLVQVGHTFQMKS